MKKLPRLVGLRCSVHACLGLASTCRPCPPSAKSRRLMTATSAPRLTATSGSLRWHRRMSMRMVTSIRSAWLQRRLQRFPPRRRLVLRNDGLGQDGRWRFTPQPMDMGELYSGSSDLAWGDFDGDGDHDLLVGTEGMTRLYRNDAGQLSDSGLSFPGLSRRFVLLRRLRPPINLLGRMDNGWGPGSCSCPPPMVTFIRV